MNLFFFHKYNKTQRVLDLYFLSFTLGNDHHQHSLEIWRFIRLPFCQIDLNTMHNIAPHTKYTILNVEQNIRLTCGSPVNLLANFKKFCNFCCELCALSRNCWHVSNCVRHILQTIVGNPSFGDTCKRRTRYSSMSFIVIVIVLKEKRYS